MIWARSLENATFLVKSRQTYDHLVDASIKTIKYLNDLEGGCIGPHISHWILSKKDGDSKAIIDGDGFTINFPWEQALINLFFLLFMGPTAFFGTVHESYFTISTNFYLYL